MSPLIARQANETSPLHNWNQTRRIQNSNQKNDSKSPKSRKFLPLICAGGRAGGVGTGTRGQRSLVEPPGPWRHPCPRPGAPPPLDIRQRKSLEIDRGWFCRRFRILADFQGRGFAFVVFLSWNFDAFYIFKMEMCCMNDAVCTFCLGLMLEELGFMLVKVSFIDENESVGFNVI